PATAVRAEEPRHYDDGTELHGRLGLGDAAGTLEKGGRPEGEGPDREGIGRVAEHGEDIGTVAEQGAIGGTGGAAKRHGGAAWCRCADGVVRAARRLVQAQREGGE